MIRYAGSEDESKYVFHVSVGENLPGWTTPPAP